MTQSVSADPSPAAPGRARPVTIPWREIARRLAEGEKPGAVAAGLAIDEDRIWRHLRKSLRFRTYLRQAIERQKQLAELLLEGAGRSAMVALGRQPENLDGGLLRCLLDEAGRTAGDELPTSGNLAKRIEHLGETGAPPPNMALRKRLNEKIRAQNAQFEAFCAEDAARLAAMSAVLPKESEPKRSQTNANEHERSETNTNEAKRSETNANEHARTAAKPDEPQRAPRLRWSRPPKPRHPPIVDQATAGLNSPDLARLRAQDLVGPAPPGGFDDSTT